jgi:hypothetical protein
MRQGRLLVQFMVAIMLMVLFIPTAVQASTAPEVTASGASPTFSAGGPSVAVDSGISVTGTDPFTGASVAINSGFQSGDVLEYTTTGPISGFLQQRYRRADPQRLGDRGGLPSGLP